MWWYITMERTAEVQLAATSAGSPVPIRPDVARRTREMVGSEAAGQFQFHPLWNWIVAEEPDLLD